MTHRAGLKEYTLMSILYGIPFGAVIGLIYESLVIALILMPVSGILFGGLTALFMRLAERRFIALRRQIETERKVFCDGTATIRRVGGWMLFTERGLEFYPSSPSPKRQEIFIPMEMIESVGCVQTTLFLSTHDHFRFDFIVLHADTWRQELERVLLSRPAPPTEAPVTPAEAQETPAEAPLTPGEASMPAETQEASTAASQPPSETDAPEALPTESGDTHASVV